MSQLTLEQAFQTAVRRHQLGQLAQAQALYTEILARRPNHVGALHLLGVIARQSGQYEVAVDLIRRAIALQPDNAEAHYNLGGALRDAGQLDAAITAYRQAIALKPNYPQSYNNLSNALREKGQVDHAIAASRQAIAFQPNFPEAYNNLGNALSDNRQLGEAAAAYRQAIALKPDFPEAHNNLGAALPEAAQRDEAIAAFRQAIALKPDFPQAYNNLGAALAEEGQLDDAIAAFRQAVAVKPNYAEACSNLGAALAEKGQVDDAVAAYRHAIALKPDFPGAYNNLGAALRDKGRLDEAIAAYRQAIALQPDDSDAHSNLVYVLHFHPDQDGRAILAEHRHWACVHAQPLASEIRGHDNDRSPDRRLKVAFVSPDLRAHPVGNSLVPLLENLDPEQVEIVCYSDARRSDAVTEKLKSLADQWQDVLAMDDAHLAKVIRRDRIDILVDTTLHTGHNRLLVFAREPAPVQLTMLGPPITTGLSTMHYRLTDPYLDPPGVSDGDYTEISIRLPHCFWIYRPPPFAIPPNDLPARANGFVTFGSLNQFSKVTGPALELWLQILQSVRNSRLMIQSAQGDHLDALRKRFDDGGIAPDRVKYVGRTFPENYLRRYHELDICLDPFPFNGHTTSMDALWMGVPSVTLRGQTAVGRGGASILSNVGLTDWIADSPEQYVSIATRMAGDLSSLGKLRSSLRQRLLNSPLTDGKQFALDVQSAFRRVWHDWLRQVQQNQLRVPDC